MACVPCTGGEITQAAAAIGVLAIILSLLVYSCRRRLRRMQKKYANVFRDVLRIATINLSFAQVNNSLSIMLDIPMPPLYQKFLEKYVSWVNVDLIQIFSIDCVGTVNYFSNIGAACFIPLFVVVATIIHHLLQQQHVSGLVKHMNTPLEKNAAKLLRANIAAYIFELADTDGGGTVDVLELRALCETVQSKKKFTLSQLELFLQEVHKASGARGGGGVPVPVKKDIVMRRANFLATATDPTKAPLMEEFFGKKWLTWGSTRYNYSKHLEGCLTVLFLVHAPVSQRLFMFFACQEVGTKQSFLKADYSVQCNEGQHAALWPFVLVYMSAFAVLFPSIILMVLWFHRKSLHAARQKNRFGFLYRRFQKGAEFWEMHELFRKLMLTGALIFLPPKTRAAAAILICIGACCTLNFFRPHINRVVLGIGQVSFLISPMKYLVFLLIALNHGPNQLDETLMGYVLIGLDVLFMCSSIFAAAAVMYVLRGSLKKTVAGGATVVVPTASTRSSKRQLTKQMSLQQMRTVVVEDKVTKFQQSHAESHKAAMDQIRQREKQADARVRQRLIERRRLKAGQGKGKGKGKVTKDTTLTANIRSWNLNEVKNEQQEENEMVMIEKVRSIMKEKIGTIQRLRGAFTKLDLDANGVLSREEFEQLVRKILKKAIDKNIVNMLWDAAWEQRKHGKEDEIDAPTLGHWLCLD